MSTTTLNPYLSFESDARAAMDFYHSVFGGTLTMSTFGESGMADDPADENKIMHAQLTTDGGFVLMASDTNSHMTFAPASAFSVSLSGTDEAELRGYWNKLAQGATVTIPLEMAPWGDSFGMLNDKFGTPWMVNITQQAQ